MTLQYNVITIGGALILVAMVSILYYYQWSNQQRHERNVLQKKVDDRGAILDNFLSHTPFYITQLRTGVEYYLERGEGSAAAMEMEKLPEDAPDGSYFAVNKVTPPFKIADLGNLFGTGSYEERLKGEDRRELLAALSIFPTFKAAHQEIPDFFAWSYYQSVNKFTAIYPWAKTEDILGHDPNLTVPKVIEDVLAMDLMKLGSPRSNPNRLPYWTPVYMDPGGKGLMVSHGAPVYARGTFYGIVATDVALSQVGKYADNLGYPNGLLVLTNERNQVLATNMNQRLNQDTFTPLEALLPESLKPETAHLTAFHGVDKVEDFYVARVALDSVPWNLTFLVPVSDLNRMGYYGMLGYLVILFGLCLFLVAIYVVLLRRFVIPAVALTAHIRAEAAEGSSHVPEVSPLWQPWFQTVSDTFALKTVTSNLPGAIYQLKQDTDKEGLVTQFISRGISELAGVDPDMVHRDGWEKLIVEEDRIQLLAQIKKSAQDLKPFFYECRLRTARGKQKWIRLASKPRKEPNGEVIWEGLLLDITKRKLAEDALRDSEERLRSILDAPLVPIAISSLETQRITFINQRGAHLFGLDLEDALGKFGPDYWLDDEARGEIFRIMRRKGIVENYEVRFMKESGKHFWALLSAIPMTYRNEPSLLVTLNDITERKKLEEELKRAATVDFLTDAYNRRHFLHLGRREYERAARHNNDLTVLMMDIDHFKRVNDTYGHPAGDETIRTMAQTCLNSIRSIDIFGRLGGEEFAAILPETDLADAVRTAERLRQTVEAISVVYEGQTINFTVSIGVTKLLPTDTAVESLLDRADKALYKAKDGGRNRVVPLESDDTVM
ncbi:MAG: diguanylate cyclase [Acidobacteriota bacterium]|nr:diguanylate cyclase [Acidobacteriota bacterium]